MLWGCSVPEEPEIWYGVSDRYGFMLAFDRDGQFLVVGAIELSLLDEYRDALAKHEIESNYLGALQSLFGQKGSHYLQGTQANWIALTEILLAQENVSAQKVRPSFQAMVTLVLRYSGYLRKSPAVDTLEKLIGPQTTVQTVVETLALLEEGVAKIRFYDMNRFLTVGEDPFVLQQWIADWTRNVLKEAIQ
jgi:hypothetical protein